MAKNNEVTKEQKEMINKIYEKSGQQFMTAAEVIRLGREMFADGEFDRTFGDGSNYDGLTTLEQAEEFARQCGIPKRSKNQKEEKKAMSTDEALSVFTHKIR